MDPEDRHSCPSSIARFDLGNPGENCTRPSKPDAQAKKGFACASGFYGRVRYLAGVALHSTSPGCSRHSTRRKTGSSRQSVAMAFNVLLEQTLQAFVEHGHRNAQRAANFAGLQRGLAATETARPTD